MVDEDLDNDKKPKSEYLDEVEDDENPTDEQNPVARAGTRNKKPDTEGTIPDPWHRSRERACRHETDETGGRKQRNRHSKKNTSHMIDCLRENDCPSRYRVTVAIKIDCKRENNCSSQDRATVAMRGVRKGGLDLILQVMM